MPSFIRIGPVYLKIQPFLKPILRNRGASQKWRTTSCTFVEYLTNMHKLKALFKQSHSRSIHFRCRPSHCLNMFEYHWWSDLPKWQSVFLVKVPRNLYTLSLYSSCFRTSCKQTAFSLYPDAFVMCSRPSRKRLSHLKNLTYMIH